MKRIYLIILCVCCTLCSFAQKEQADSAYIAERYEEAAVLYDSLIVSEGQSLEALYNLGCCYYRMDRMANAVLCFERALLLEPGDEDVRIGLEKARARTVDKITSPHEMFFVKWGRQLVSLMSVDNWGWAAVALFVLVLVNLAVYLFATRIGLRKAGFSLAVVALLLCVVANVCAWRGRVAQTDRLGAIVMVSATTVRSTPASSGTDLFVLHEGARVDIVDDSMADWKEIVLADGKRGWVENSHIERI